MPTLHYNGHPATKSHYSPADHDLSWPQVSSCCRQMQLPVCETQSSLAKDHTSYWDFKELTDRLTEWITGKFGAYGNMFICLSVTVSYSAHLPSQAHNQIYQSQIASQKWQPPAFVTPLTQYGDILRKKQNKNQKTKMLHDDVCHGTMITILITPYIWNLTQRFGRESEGPWGIHFCINCLKKER